MANPRATFALAMAMALLVAALQTREVGCGLLSGESEMGWTAARSMCEGTVGECLEEEEVMVEMAMDSESNRRILASTQYLSYDALGENKISCSYPGSSYYNCRPHAFANAYTRPCNQITHCARY